MGLNHKGTQQIETIRLILRKFRAEDAEDMYRNWAGDPLVCRYLSWGPHREVDDSLRRIINWVGSYGKSNFYEWVVELKGLNKAIGSISVEFSNEGDESCEVGYCIGAAYWNRGIMTEALRAVMHFLFYEVGYRRIQAKHDVLNKASGKVMMKAGMQFLKTEYRVGTRRDGSQYDCAVYVKYREDE